MFPLCLCILKELKKKKKRFPIIPSLNWCRFAKSRKFNCWIETCSCLNAFISSFSLSLVFWNLHYPVMFLNLHQNIRETRKRCQFNVQDLLPLHTDLHLSSFNCKNGAPLNTFRAVILSGFPIEAIKNITLHTLLDRSLDGAFQGQFTSKLFMGEISSFHVCRTVSYTYIFILIFCREFVPV